MGRLRHDGQVQGRRDGGAIGGFGGGQVHVRGGGGGGVAVRAEGQGEQQGEEDGVGGASGGREREKSAELERGKSEETKPKIQ